MNPGGSAGPYLMSILSKLGSKYNHRELYLSIWMDKRSVNVKCPFVFVSNSQSRFFHSGTHLWADTMKTGFSTPSIIEAPLQPYWSWSTWYSKLLQWYEPNCMMTHFSHSHSKMFTTELHKMYVPKRGHQVCTPLVILALNWGETTGI